jgi:Zn-dependent protease with chaperone function
MKRIFLFVLTNIAVLVVISITLRLLGVDRVLEQSGGINFSALMVMSAGIGFSGSIISLLMSKWMAKRSDGTRIFGEKAIDVPRGTQREKIRDVFLVPHHGDVISVYPPVLDAAWWADYIIIGPGDLFTSIIAGLIVPGVKEALQKSAGV